MVEELAIVVLLGTKFIDDHILAVQPDERKTTVPDLMPFAFISQGAITAIAVLAEQGTIKVTNKTFHKTGNNTRKDHIQSTIL